LKANGNVVPRRSVRPLKASEIASDTEKSKRKIFDDLIKSRHGTSLPKKPDAKESDEDSVSDPEKVHEEPLSEYEDPDESPRLIPEISDPVDAVEMH